MQINKSKVNTLLADDKISECLDYLMQVAPEEQSLILLKSRFNRNKKDMEIGILDRSTYSMELNRVTNAIQSFVKDNADEEETNAGNTSNSSSPSNNMSAQGNGNIIIQGVEGTTININQGNTTNNVTNNNPSNRPQLKTKVAAGKPLKVFISYSKRDREHVEDFKDHASLLVRKKLIETFDDRNLIAGEEWDSRVKEEIDQADIILLFVSASFMATDYIWNVELGKAMEHHQAGTTKVIPIIVRPCDWEDAAFAKLNALPTKGVPVTKHDDKDEGWYNVVLGIKRLIESMKS